MNKNNKAQVNPFVIAIMSIISFLLGFSGVERLFNNDFLIGIPQLILGSVGGVLGIIQYRLSKKQKNNTKPN